MKVSMIGWRAVVAAALLMAAACGSSGAATSGAGLSTAAASTEAEPAVENDVGGDMEGGAVAGASGVSSRSISSDTWDAARALADAHGVDGGLAATVYALERGYSAGQLVTGALGGAVDADGVIAGDGAPLAPEGAREGVVEVPDDIGADEGAASSGPTGGLEVVLAVAQTGQLDRAELFADLVIGAQGLAPQVFMDAENFDIFTAEPTVASALIQQLAASGYSLQQITDALTEQTVFGSATIGQESPGALPGPCPALYDDEGRLLGPARPVVSDCAFALDALTVDADASGEDRESEEDAATESVVDASPTTARYVGTVEDPALSSDDAISFSGDRTGGYESASFEALVDADTVQLTVTYTYYVDLRGGIENPGPSGDQFCGVTYARTVSGTGAAGSPTSISLDVVANSVVEEHGALCDGDFSLVEKAPGDRGGRFEGQLNGLGLEGEYDGGFFSGVLPIEASD